MALHQQHQVRRREVGCVCMQRWAVRHPVPPPGTAFYNHFFFEMDVGLHRGILRCTVSLHHSTLFHERALHFSQLLLVVIITTTKHKKSKGTFFSTLHSFRQRMYMKQFSTVPLSLSLVFPSNTIIPFILST